MKAAEQLTPYALGQTRLTRLRWAVRGALALGVLASLAANVLHAEPNVVGRCIAAWPPVALLVTVELISRVPVHRWYLSLARWVSTSAVAGIAAWVSYGHMADVASRYGESATSAHMIPISVDGLVVVASVCLVEIGGRLRELESTAPVVSAPVVPAPLDEVTPVVPVPVTAPVSAPAQEDDHCDALVTAPRPAPEQTSTPAPEPRATSTKRTTRKTSMARPGKRPTSKKTAFAAYIAGVPAEDTRTDAELIRTYAPMVGLHENTARRYLADIRRAAQTDGADLDVVTAQDSAHETDATDVLVGVAA